MKTQKNRSMAAYGMIKEMMLQNLIVPGQRLPLAEYAEKLGMSRTPVNNALSALAREGYLNFVPNQGYSVRRLTLQEVEDLQEAREILEHGTIGKAIRLMTDKTASELEKTKKNFEDSLTQSTNHVLFFLDAAFHTAIIAMAGNQYLVERYRELSRMLGLKFRPTGILLSRLPQLAREHGELFAAICTRDVEQARYLIRRHSNSDRQTFFACPPNTNPRLNPSLQERGSPSAPIGEATAVHRFERHSHYPSFNRW